ncbi:GAF and ANTAR domain-containing protein [Kineosporia sp. NBRC 101677]|uniref:GAF and ANTAR domain-containing protein n=1 Tax=Kineosporia sp. NBRC 101677 TaxID=3032197 RepID=UPI002553F215|nr:GAF and ANTAR domain-containing protein [Kineosporia sp. NBRC 101677]
MGGFVQEQSVPEAARHETPPGPRPGGLEVSSVDGAAGPIVLKDFSEDGVSSPEHQAEIAIAELDAFGADGLRPALTRLSELACQLLHQVDAVSIVLGSPDEPYLTATSSPLAQKADGAQLMTASGPSLEAMKQLSAVTVDDLSADPRWPRLHHRFFSADMPVRSCLALPIRSRKSPVGHASAEPAGVLTLYACSAAAFSSSEVGLHAERLAVRALGLVRTHEEVHRLRHDAEKLREALTSRSVIDQAKGLIMGERRCSAEGAFAELVRISNDTNQKVRHIAQAIVDEALTPRHEKPQLLHGFGILPRPESL